MQHGITVSLRAMQRPSVTARTAAAAAAAVAAAAAAALPD